MPCGDWFENAMLVHSSAEPATEAQGAHDEKGVRDKAVRPRLASCHLPWLRALCPHVYTFRRVSL